MKKNYLRLTLFFFIGLININNIQAGIGVINIRLLLEQAPQAIIKTQVIENEFKTRKQRLITLQKKIDEKKIKFIQEKELLSKEERQKKNISLQKMKEGMNALENEFRTDYVIRQREEMDKFFDNVRVHVKKIAKERKLIVILQKESVFFNNNNIDITEKVLSILNKQVD